MGYGDIYPITTVGKILGAVIAILGVGMVALPTGDYWFRFYGRNTMQ